MLAQTMYKSISLLCVAKECHFRLEIAIKNEFVMQESTFLHDNLVVQKYCFVGSETYPSQKYHSSLPELSVFCDFHHNRGTETTLSANS